MGSSVFVMAWEICGCDMRTPSCSMDDLVPWPGMEPGWPALGVQSLSHWTTREIPFCLIFKVKKIKAGINRWDLIRFKSFVRQRKHKRNEKTTYWMEENILSRERNDTDMCSFAHLLNHCSSNRINIFFFYLCFSYKRD